MSSKLVLREKYIQKDKSIVEMKVWAVPKSLMNPSGYKYSLYVVKEGAVLVGYDNHHPKGDHRHYGTRQEPYHFSGLEDLLRDFNEDRRRLALP